MVAFEARATRAAIPFSRHMVSFSSLHRSRDSAFNKRHSDKYYNLGSYEYTALSTSSESKLAVCTLDNVENNCAIYTIR